MPLMFNYASLQMEWCIECHRGPEKNLRPRDQVFNMRYQQPTTALPVVVDGKSYTDQMALGKYLSAQVQPAQRHGYNQLLDVSSVKRLLALSFQLETAKNANDDQNGKPHIEPVCPGKKDKLDLVQVRSEIEKKNGPEFWRSLEELAGSPEFREMMHREFPKGASELVDSVSRRGFFKLMGSSLALAGMTACTKQPFEPIVPYVRQPEELVLGQPMFYATAFTLGGYGSPLLVTSREFRPIKIEGNDRHPASQGGTDVFAQASILDLYDPDRSQNVTYLGDIASWGELARALQGPLNAQQAKKGAGHAHSVAELFIAYAGRPEAATA